MRAKEPKSGSPEWYGPYRIASEFDFFSLAGCAEYGFHQKAISYKAEEQFYNRLLLGSQYSMLEMKYFPQRPFHFPGL